jgi:hypothetical protein
VAAVEMNHGFESFRDFIKKRNRKRDLFFRNPLLVKTLIVDLLTGYEASVAEVCERRIVPPHQRLPAPEGGLQTALFLYLYCFCRFLSTTRMSRQSKKIKFLNRDGFTGFSTLWLKLLRI